MSYSRTYNRHPNGAGTNRMAEINRGQRAERGIETGHPGSGAEQSLDQKQPGETPKQERFGGFTMIRPDEKKRAHLLEVARRETDAAQARSEARRSQHIHERPRRLGGTAEYSSTINQKQKSVTAASKGLETQKKREKWQREKREREERENLEKKAKARAQAERNEVLQAIRTQEMIERHREAHRWRNQEFLDKLERSNSNYRY